jgi:hypothetical protein
MFSEAQMQYACGHKTLRCTHAILWHIVHLHFGASVERVETSKQRLQGVGVQERMILLHTAHVDRELKICNTNVRNSSEIGYEFFSCRVTVLYGDRYQK